MKSTQLIIGALLCLTLIGTASAATQRTDLGALSEGHFGIVGDAVASAPSFKDSIQSAIASRAKGALRDVPAAGRYTFAELTPGSYTVAIFGSAKYLGGYAATYRSSVAAVPEIETWLMLLIGFGLAAYQLHRKQKTLGQQVLIDDALGSSRA